MMSSIDPACLDAAMLAAEPRLVRRRMHDATAGDTWRAETRSMEDAARCRVRRVIAALNGVDIERNAAQWTDHPAILSRSFVERLKSALLNEKVCAAMDDVLGPEKSSEILGEITAL